MADGAEILIVAFGASSRIARTAIRRARDKGIKVGLLRPITLWPFPEDAISQAIDGGCKALMSVELNMGQMVEDVRLAANGRADVSFYGRTGGVLPTPEEVLEQIEKLAAGEAPNASARATVMGSVLPQPIDRKSSYERGE